MKSSLVVLLIFVLSLQAAYALPIQAQANAPGPGEPGYRPGSGTTICIDVPRVLDARKLKADEEIVGRVTQDLVYNGKIIVPRDAKVMGKVADLKIGVKDDPETRLLLAFHKIVAKDGREFEFDTPPSFRRLPLNAALQLPAPD